MVTSPGDDAGDVVPVEVAAYVNGMRRCTMCWVAYTSADGHLLERGHLPVPLLQAPDHRRAT